MRRIIRLLCVLVFLGLWGGLSTAHAQFKGSSSSGTATASAPSLTEGATTNLFFDLFGNLRVTLETLLAGEDLTNNLMMTSGGASRLTTFASVTSATTSAISAVPTGTKTFYAQIINATSETKAATIQIWGSPFNNTTYGVKICEITLPSTASSLELHDACPKTDVTMQYWWYITTVYISASAAPVTVYAMD